jgi:integrase
VPGPLASLMALRLVDLDAAAVEAWAAKEAKDRPARVRLALRLLKAFLRWAATEPDLKGKTDNTAASTKKAREAAGKAKAKNDYLQREQLAAWFEHVRAIPNPVISAYLQALLLTGARREELGALRWEDVNFQWKGLDLKDKIEGRRAVPLTPYVESLLSGLPRRNEWVFSSVQALDLKDKNAARRARYHATKGQPAPAGDVATRSASGRLVEPSIAHRRACVAAGLEGLTLHGLRRSFASLCEWLDIPGGISAQIQGHAPQGVREQNYIRRPLDLLRVHHQKIEAWMLEQAGIAFDAGQPQGLRVVSAA